MIRRNPPPRRRPPPPQRPRLEIGREATLAQRLELLDGRPFAAYRELRGEHALEEFTLVFDQVPVDPAAGPARVRLRLGSAAAGLGLAATAGGAASLAAADFVARHAARAAEQLLAPDAHAAPGSGRILFDRPGPSIVERTACRIADGVLELRLALDLPAWERTIRGRHARALLTEALPRFARASMLLGSARRDDLERHLRAASDHASIRAALRTRGLVAFVAEGAAIEGVPEPFRPPEGRAVAFELPGGDVRGFGVPGGITLFAGGERSGAPELLRAIAAGTEPRPPGLPGAGVVTLHGAAFVRSEGGASSQRDALQRALACGTGLVLLDEDRSAPGFLGRDPRLRRLLPERAAGGIPYADVARDLYTTHGVSTIAAAASMGDLLAIADVVLIAVDGRLEEAEDAVRRNAGLAPPPSRPFETAPAPTVRIEASPSGDDRRADLAGSGSIRVAGARVALPPMEPPLDDAQRRGLAYALAEAGRLAAEPVPVHELLDALERELDAGALDVWGGGRGDLARPPRASLAAGLYRLPSARFEGRRASR